MKTARKGLETAMLDRLLCTGALFSDLVPWVLKHTRDRMIRVPQKRFEVPMSPRGIHAKCDKASECEVILLQSGQEKD
jgi:hypothetical protein